MQATNRRTLGAMVRELGKGGKLVWIAPSGGRDRPDADTGDWLPHKYDAGELSDGPLCCPNVLAVMRLTVVLFL